MQYKSLMKNKTTNSNEVNKSNFTANLEKLNKIIKKVKSGEGASVSYVFLSKRIIFNKEHPEGKVITKKSFRCSPISVKALENIKDTKSNLTFLKMLEDTKNDIGASYIKLN